MFNLVVGDELLRMQVRNSSILMYYHIERSWENYQNTKRHFSNSTTYTGNVTSHSKKRIEKAVNIFLQISPLINLYNPITKTTHPFQLNFITLTISNKERIIAHSFAYKQLLKPFLTWLRDTKKITTYIWKAEVQIRGQVHYHITLNQFLHLTEIKEKWNYLQNKSGILKEYTDINKHSNPNSTDVHSVVKIHNIEAYLCKYMSKHLSKHGSGNNSKFLEDLPVILNEQYESYNAINKRISPSSDIYNNSCKEKPLITEIVIGNILSCTQATYFDDYSVDGKVWDCSKNLKGKSYYTIHAGTNNLARLATHLEANEYREYTNDFCMIVTTNPSLKKSILNKKQKKHYNNYIQSIATQ